MNKTRVMIVFASGLRAKELASLRLRHVDVEESGLRLDASWTKNRKPGLQPVPTYLVEELLASARGKDPEAPLLSVPSHPARDLRKDLERAGVQHFIEGEGKIDFHALRVAFTTFVIESGANVKDAQELVRHSTPYLTMNVYARARKGSPAKLVERMGERLRAARRAPSSPPLASGPRGVVGEADGGGQVASAG